MFVLFTQPRVNQNLVLGESRFGRLQPMCQIPHDNWAVLSILDQDHLKIERDRGTESTPTENFPQLAAFLRDTKTGLEFNCVLTPQGELSLTKQGPMFFPLLKNKYGQTISGLIQQGTKAGTILLLPQLKDKPAAVLELLQTVLPEVCPHLFPFIEDDMWVRWEEYEHPGVLERLARQADIRRKASEEVARLEQEIEIERAAFSYLPALLTHSSDELVTDVKRRP